MTGPSLGREQIVVLLTELGADLHGQGVRADLFVVGGAAMALAYNTRRATRDIDAVFEPKLQVYAAAARIRVRHDLPEDWLNEAVREFLPGPDPARQEILDVPGVRVSVPSPRYLLALKVAAARVDRDADDIRVLADLVGARTAQEVLDLTGQIMGRNVLLPKVHFLIEEIFSETAPSPAARPPSPPR